MKWKNIVRGIIGGAKKRDTVTHYKGIPTYEPATPEPNYICQNCGMFINTGHKHTRLECQLYQDNPTNPDLRAHRVILPGRNDPKIHLPYYYDFSKQSITENEKNES